MILTRFTAGVRLLIASNKRFDDSNIATDLLPPSHTACVTRFNPFLWVSHIMYCLFPKHATYFSLPQTPSPGLELKKPSTTWVDCVWNALAYAQKTDFVFRRKRRAHLNRRGRQFSRLLAAEVYASAVVMLDTPCSVVVWMYWVPTPFASFPFTSPPLRHRVPSGFNWTLPAVLSHSLSYIQTSWAR